jgi:hypothetical protein
MRSSTAPASPFGGRPKRTAVARRHGPKDELAQSLLIRAQIHGKALQQQSTDPVDVQGRKHEIPIDGCHQWLGAKVEIWDETSGSNDGEYPEPENVTYHKGEEIQHIGCVYQKINLERHCLSPLPLIVAALAQNPRRGGAAALALGAAAVQIGTAYLFTPEAKDLGGLPQDPLRARHAHGDHQPVHRLAGAGHRQSPDG